MDRDDNEMHYNGSVLMFDGTPVLLDSWVAEAFEEETRSINQAVARNPEKFDHRHAFRLTVEQWEFLKSRGVIPKTQGRGGSRTPPMVYTQKGVARLATILTTPKALQATDLIIDIFTEVYQQIAVGNGQVTIANPGRLIPQPDIAARIANIKSRMLDQIDTLLNTEVGETGNTVKDELSSVGAALYDDLRARLQRRGLENEKLEAETLKLLEEVKSLQQERLEKSRRAEEELVALQLDNISKRMQLIRENLQLLDNFEPDALVDLSQNLLPHAQAPVLHLPAPETANKGSDT